MEKAIYWFSRNHVAANLLMLSVVVMGLVTWQKLKKEIFPETSVDAVSVQVPFPNATPEEVERGVCVPVEEAILDVEGIDRVTSTAAPSMGVINAEVASGYSVRNVMDDIKTRVDAIDNFPEEAETPVLEELVLNAQVLSVAISADTDERTLRRMAERLRDELLAYEPAKGSEKGGFFSKLMQLLAPEPVGPAITKVEIALDRPYEISIEVPEETLRSYGLTFDQVTAAVRGSSLDLPAGSVRTEGGEVLVRTEAKRYTAAEFAEITVVSREDGSVVKLGEIAQIVDGFEEVDLSGSFDGRRALLLNVFRVGDQDTLKVARAAKTFVRESAAQMFPPGVTLEIWKDDSLYLEGRLDLLGRNAINGLLLVLLVLSLFLRPQLAVLVSIGIPVAFLGAVMMMPSLGVSINMISLFAFILVLGIVVDDAIVVGENVYERIVNGEDPKDAAPRGTQEVGVVVVFGVLTTMMAFTPMLGLSGVSGKIWPNIPMVVIPTLAWSLLQSKFVLPSHLALLKAPKRGEHRRWHDRVLDGVDRLLKRFIQGVYQPLLGLSLRWRYVTLCFFITLLFSVVALVATGWVKFQFFPEVEADVVISRLTMPDGVAFEATEKAVRKIEAASQRLQQEYVEKYGEPIIRHTLAAAGTQPFQQGLSELRTKPQASHIGEVTIELVAGGKRKVAAMEVASRWRELTGPIPGALDLSFRTQAAGGGNAIDLEITGSNLTQLTAASDMLKERMSKIKGVIDIADNNRPGKRELKLEMLPAGEALGLRLVDVSRQVRQAFYGDEAQRLQRGRDEVKVMVRYPEAERRSIANLADMKIRAADGTEIPFSAAASFEYGRSASTIQRADRHRAVKVTADIDKGMPNVNANEVVARINADILPEVKQRYPSVRFGYQGEQKDQRQSVSEMGAKGLIAILGIYVLLAIPLRSYLQPLIVMSVIPFGVVGAIMGHVVMGMVLSIMSMCGVVALAGVVVNDSLVMVEFVNRERGEGKSLVEAAIHAGGRRFRPILLTSATTFAGLMPMVFETDVQARFLVPMAVSLGFGVLFATAITLILIPTVYYIMEDIKRLFVGRERANADMVAHVTHS
ncbi:MAG: efflux RND transporter permease subunit [Verrucomicrobiales bacterium]|nr:efflux RND transporter permease subunit [Verrucomicrobiales bacterium]